MPEVRTIWAGAFDKEESIEARVKCSEEVREIFRGFVSIGTPNLLKTIRDADLGWVFEVPCPEVQNKLTNKSQNGLQIFRGGEVILGVVPVGGILFGAMVYENLVGLGTKPPEVVFVGCCRSWTMSPTTFGDGTRMEPKKLYISDHDTNILRDAVRTDKKLLLVDDAIAGGYTLHILENQLRKFKLKIYKTAGNKAKSWYDFPWLHRKFTENLIYL